MIANGATLCMWHYEINVGPRSISDDFQAAQFYTCCREQMVPADNVAGGGSTAEKIERGLDRVLGSTAERREKKG